MDNTTTNKEIERQLPNSLYGLLLQTVDGCIRLREGESE